MSIRMGMDTKECGEICIPLHVPNDKEWGWKECDDTVREMGSESIWQSGVMSVMHLEAMKMQWEGEFMICEGQLWIEGVELMERSQYEGEGRRGLSF